MAGRVFSGEFKRQAVKLVKERASPSRTPRVIWGFTRTCRVAGCVKRPPMRPTPTRATGR